MPALAPPQPQMRFARPLKIGLVLVVVLVVAAVSVWKINRSHVAASKAPTAGEPEDSNSPERASGMSMSSDTVSLPKSAWKVAGVKIAPAEFGPVSANVEVTGQVALNEDRIAHIFPLVEGRVEEVLVRFGQNVRAGDVLAIIQSKEVGQRKLELVQARLAREIAEIKRDRAVLVDKNVQELIGTLKEEVSVEEIETKFKGRPMGTFRERLVTAYAELAKAKADYERLAELTERGVTASKDLTSAEAIRDAARAAYTAILDESKHEAHHQAIGAEQTFREADTSVAASQAALEILGYKKSDLEEIDPVKEGETISYYPVVAPFDGTILTKDVALLETVDMSRQLFEIADLSSVWIIADVFERHLPLLADLQGKSVEVRCDLIPDLKTEAKVFFTGETVEQSTRTVRLRAMAPNPDHKLKPGLFVEVELPGKETQSVVQVPESAVIEHAGEQFVFVQVGDDSFQRHDVTTGNRSGGNIEIVKGLKAGEPVAVEGGFALKSRLLSDLMSEE